MQENNNINSEHWKVLALLLESEMKRKGINRTQLAENVGVASSTIKRFFELEFCLKFDLVLKIAKELEVKVDFKPSK